VDSGVFRSVDAAVMTFDAVSYLRSNLTIWLELIGSIYEGFLAGGWEG
jgi:hypothetical protein